MRFQRKAQLQWVFSRLPKGEEAYYLLQRHLTRSFPRSASVFANKVRRARQHLLKLRDADPAQDWSQATFLEVGAGWDLIIPLTYYCCGINTQHLIDFIPRIRLELVNDALVRLEPFRAELEQEWGLVTRPLGGPVRHAAELSERFGLHLHAPMDARETSMAAHSIDAITSTSTLEHVFAEHLPAILQEWRRILRPGGIVSGHIDLKDHYRLDDSSVNYYNFLTFDEAGWRAYNPPLHHQNRLRASQFQEAFETAGFEILDVEDDAPTAEDLALLAQMSLDPAFQHFSPEDLGIKIRWIVARSPG